MEEIACQQSICMNYFNTSYVGFFAIKNFVTFKTDM